MIEILKNPLIILAMILGTFVLLIRYKDSIIKSLKATKNKVKEKIEEKKEYIKTDNDVKEKQEVVEKVEETEKPDENKKGKFIKKPTITKVFEVKKKVDEIIEKSGDAIPNFAEEEFLKKMEFAKNGKVSKVKKISEDKLIQKEEIDEEESLVEKEDIKASKEIYFDKTRRISRCMECGSLEHLFSSHLKDDYLNIDENRHLRLDEKFANNLYNRTEQTLNNSKMKLIVDKSSEIETNIDSEKSWIEDRKREILSEAIIEDNQDSFDDETLLQNDEINLKNIALSSAILKRKR